MLSAPASKASPNVQKKFHKPARQAWDANSSSNNHLEISRQIDEEQAGRRVEQKQAERRALLKHKLSLGVSQYAFAGLLEPERKMQHPNAQTSADFPADMVLSTPDVRSTLSLQPFKNSWTSNSVRRMSVGPETIQASTKDQRRLSEICDREWNLDKHVTELGRRNMYGDITSLRRERRERGGPDGEKEGWGPA